MLQHETNPVLEIVSIEQLNWSGGFFEVSPRDYSSIAFRIQGTVAVTTENENLVANPNDILYIPQRMSYTAEYTDTEVIVIHFITRYNDKNIAVHHFENNEKIYKMFLEALSVWNNKEPGFNYNAMAQLYKILGNLDANQTKTILPKHFLSAVSLINSGFKNSELCIDEICKKSGISPTAFRQLFKKHYQKTPTEYITDLRLNHARNLISSGFSIESAAYSSGFNDSKYFARLVKRYFNCTPRDLKTYGK